MNIFPPPPRGTAREQIIANVFGTNTYSNDTWMSEDVEHLPFGEVLFWARKLMSKAHEKDSKYSFHAWKKEHPNLDHSSMSPHEVFTMYSEWKAKQPPEGDLVTTFGHQMRQWFDRTDIGDHFLQAYRSYGWYLINKGKSIARQKMAGNQFADVDWQHYFRCRQVFSDLDQAMYRMDMHNAGAWDLDFSIANNLRWVESFWIFAQQEKVQFSTLWSSWDKASIRASGLRQYWYEDGYDLVMMPDDLEAYFDNGKIEMPFEDPFDEDASKEVFVTTL